MYSPMDYLVAKSALKQLAEEQLAYAEEVAQPRRSLAEKAAAFLRRQSEAPALKPGSRPTLAHPRRV